MPKNGSKILSKHAGITVTDETLNDWIRNRLSPDHPAAEILMHPPETDSWGNPYRIQSRATLDEKPRVYSTGEDGLSNTDGNDPDDIRSWDEKWWRCILGVNLLVKLHFV